MIKLPTVIISLTPERRKGLVEAIEKCEDFEIHIQQGVRGEGFMKNKEFVDNKTFQFLNGREMVPGEAGASLAHHAVYDKTIKEGWPWVLILEDNSRILEEEFLKIPNLVKQIENTISLRDQPIFVHLNLDSARLIGRRVKLESSAEVYETYTVLRIAKAYLMNQTAAQIAVSEGLPVKDVTDWPHWILKMKFLINPKDAVYIDRHLPSEIGIRINPREAIHHTNFRLLFEKIKVGIYLLSGFEAVRYKRKTGLNDYYEWIFLDRVYRIMGKFLGKPDFQKKNVLILDNAIIRSLRRVSNILPN